LKSQNTPNIQKKKPNKCLTPSASKKSQICEIWRKKANLTTLDVRQTVQPHFFHARLLAFDKTPAQPHFAVVNCADVVMSLFYSPVLTRSLIFLQL